MFAIGNDELEEKEDIGTEIKCPTCGGVHPIEYGAKKMPDGTWQASKMLVFYKCGDKTYLAGINGKRI